MKKRKTQAKLQINNAAPAPVQSPELNSRKGCLDTAMAAVLGDRQLNYGTAEDNFARIAAIHNTYLNIRKTYLSAEAGAVSTANASVPLTPHDVAVMAILLKVARLANTPDHADSWADIAGYAACGAAVNGAKFDAS